MSNSGKLASFVFGSTTFDADDCLQSWALTREVGDVTYFCNSNTKHAIGPGNYAFTASLAIASNSTADANVLAAGSTGTFSCFPGGNTAGNIKFTSTKGTVISSPINTSPNSVIMMDVTIALDDLTQAVAT